MKPTITNDPKELRGGVKESSCYAKLAEARCEYAAVRLFQERARALQAKLAGLSPSDPRSINRH